MKNESIALVAVFLALNVQALVNASLKDAYLNGADAKIIYRVVDDEGVPVEGARAHIWFRTTNPRLIIDDWVVNTDSNGMFTAAHRTNDRLSCGIDKDGYYHTFDRVTFSDPRTYPLVTDGKWQPFGNTKTVILKKIRNPERLVCWNRTRKHLIPSYDMWLAFDLERCQFVAPYGEGKDADVLLRFTMNTSSRKDYHMKMEVSFTNMPYAGAYQKKKDGFSDFKSDYHADTNANYLQTFMYSFDRNPQKRPVVEELGEDEYLVFRTRTKIDGEGRLMSANYGVIHGQWQFVGPGGMKIPFLVFNPTPNDTNLEPKQ